MTSGQRVTLRFLGINYRANIYVNGMTIATSQETRGTFRQFEFDVTAAVAATASSGQFSLAVEVSRPFTGAHGQSCRGRPQSQCADLAISWVDWAPTPPDANMGIWRDVIVTVGPAVEVRHPQISTTLLTGGATRLGVLAILRNLGATEVHGSLTAVLSTLNGVQLARCTVAATAAAETSSLISMSTTDCSSLELASPPLWWPWQMGTPTLVTLALTFAPQSGGAQSTIEVRTGLREVTKSIESNGNAVFRVNGKRILLLGGGWAPDLLLRQSSARQRQELELVKDLGLNAVRLEGKLQNDDLFEHVGISCVLTLKFIASPVLYSVHFDP